MINFAVLVGVGVGVVFVGWYVIEASKLLI
jgi:hypothetical protein